MTPEQFATIEKDIEDLKLGLSAKQRGFTWWVQTATSVLLLLMSAVIIPWATSVTQTLSNHGTHLQRLEDWKNLGPRFTAVDAENLRLKILSESAQNFGERVGKLAEKMDRISDEMVGMKAVFQQHLNGAKP